MFFLKQDVFLSNLIRFLKKSVKKWDSAGQKTISGGGGVKGGLRKNGFPQILISSKPFITIFMSWDIDFGSMNPFTWLKLQFRFLLLENRSSWSILGGCIIFFFRQLCNPHLRSKFKFQVLKEKHKNNIFWKFEDFCPCNFFVINCFYNMLESVLELHRITQGQRTL